MSKVYVMSQAPLFQGEKILDVKSSKKKAEQEFREMFPHMRKWEGGNGYWTAASDNSNNPMMLFLREFEVD